MNKLMGIRRKSKTGVRGDLPPAPFQAAGAALMKHKWSEVNSGNGRALPALSDTGAGRPCSGNARLVHDSWGEEPPPSMIRGRCCADIPEIKARWGEMGAMELAEKSDPLPAT